MAKQQENCLLGPLDTPRLSTDVGSANCERERPGRLNLSHFSLLEKWLELKRYCCETDVGGVRPLNSVT